MQITVLQHGVQNVSQIAGVAFSAQFTQTIQRQQIRLVYSHVFAILKIGIIQVIVHVFGLFLEVVQY